MCRDRTSRQLLTHRRPRPRAFSRNSLLRRLSFNRYIIERDTVHFGVRYSEALSSSVFLTWYPYSHGEETSFLVYPLSWGYTHECIYSGRPAVLCIALAVFTAINSEHNTKMIDPRGRKERSRVIECSPSARSPCTPRVLNETSPDLKRAGSYRGDAVLTERALFNRLYVRRLRCRCTPTTRVTRSRKGRSREKTSCRDDERRGRVSNRESYTAALPRLRRVC